MLPLWLPEPEHVDHTGRAGAITLERLCELAQTPCRASGAWTQRPVMLHVIEAGQEPWLRSERECIRFATHRDPADRRLQDMQRPLV